MSFGHADRIAAILAGAAAAGSEKTTLPIDPALYQRDDVRRILAERDVTALYLALKDAGLTQRRIAELTGQSQSEVSEILKGRRVLSYDVLVRIADRLGIPRVRMGLSYGESDAYGRGVTATNPPKGVSAEVLRRHVIALGAIAAVGAPTAGELLTELGNPSPVPLPSRIGAVHVAKVRDLTRWLGEAGCAYGSDPAVSTAAAAWGSRLLDVSGPEPVKRALMVAVSELHIEAGWAAFDGGLYDRTMFHYARGLELATEAGDAYLQAVALTQAGLATVEHGQPNDGLKMLQWGEFKTWKIPPDEQRAVVVGVSGRVALQACGQADSATALAELDCWDAANTALAKSRELWTPTRADLYGDLDRPAACLELKRGRLNAAEPFAAASARRWESGSRRGRTQAGVVLATIHVRAGEPDGLRLAHGAVTGASKLSSMRARQRLVPLADALEARPGSDHRELARMARQVAATRA